MKTGSLYIILSMLIREVNSFASLKHVKITEWNHKGFSEETFRVFFDTSLQTCMEKCRKRPKCTALTYKRLSRVCELMDTTGYTATTEGEDSVYIKRADMIDEETCNCGYAEVCLYDGDCSVQECAPLPDIANCVMLGNMNAIQSKLKIVCNAGYKEKHGHAHTSCMANGTWQFIPECVHCKCNDYFVSETGVVLSASTYLTDDREPTSFLYHPMWAKLHQIETKYGDGGWSARVVDGNQWIQTQFPTPKTVEGFATQGRDTSLYPSIRPQYVTEYTVSYSVDCSTFEYIPTTFAGNTDMTTVVVHCLPDVLTGVLCVRIHPVTWINYISMRIDVLGCN